MAELPFTVDVSNSASTCRDALRVRHQVYCVERGYEAGAGGVETDAYDAHASHVVLRDAAGDPLGTTRLVRDSHLGFPMEAVAPGVVAAMGVERRRSAELSRFSLPRGAEAAIGAPPGSLRLALVQGVVTLSGAAGHEALVAMMEPALLRLLRGAAIHFEAVGPLVEHRGLRQPCFLRFPAALERVRAERPEVWHYLVAGASA